MREAPPLAPDRADRRRAAVRTSPALPDTSRWRRGDAPQDRDRVTAAHKRWQGVGAGSDKGLQTVHAAPGRTPRGRCRRPSRVRLPVPRKTERMTMPRTLSRMGFGIGQRQCRAPGPADDDTSFPMPQDVSRMHLQIGDQVRGRVGFPASRRRALTCAALVKKDHAVQGGVEQARGIGGDAAAGAAVQEHRRHPFGGCPSRASRAGGRPLRQTNCRQASFSAVPPE